MVRTVVNKDGSITTSTEDEHDTSGTAVVTTPAAAGKPEASPAEVKVVAPEDEKPAPKSRSRAESK